MKGCRADAKKRLTLKLGESAATTELLVCEKHLYDLTDHGFKLIAKLNDEGEVEIWRPSY